MLSVSLFVFSFLFSFPNATCPFDGQSAAFSGNMRHHHGRAECQYRHVRTTYANGRLENAAHSFWLACPVQ